MDIQPEPTPSPTELALDVIDAVTCDDRPIILTLDDAETRLARLMSSIAQLKRTPAKSSANS
jgi:hypothetical protein